MSVTPNLPPASPWPTATTRLHGVLGDPVEHSRSPQLHNAAFTALGIDGCYLAFHVVPQRLGEAVAGLGSLGAVGVNVTVPHKRAVVALCDDLSDEARLVGAVNTLTWTPTGVHGDNTDARGFVASLRDLGNLRDREVHVLGAGGAARAVVVGLARQGARITVMARRAAAAADLVDLAEEAGAPEAKALDLEDDRFGAAVAAAEVLVNATPLGLAGERLPEPCHRLRPDQVAVDLVYGDARTPFLADAEAAGASTVDGWGMLLHQAALAFAGWTGASAWDAYAAMAGAAGVDRVE